jgi:thiosulfate/3-mercaptopyruvate sulfurtransferase
MPKQASNRPCGQRNDRRIDNSHAKCTRRVLVRAFAGLTLAFWPCLIGCGTNRFQQELKIEEAAIKLTKETIAGNYPLIATAELKALLASDETILLVDTMPAASSYNQGHIPGALNFVFPKVVIDEWNQTTMGDRSMSDYEAFLGEDKDRKIVFYCGYVKCPRSHNGAVFAKELGYTNVVRYPGGIDAWRGAGYKLATN